VTRARDAVVAGRTGREPAVLLGAVSAVLVWSGIAPYERGTWLLEVAPVLVGAPVLVATRSRFPLSALAYRLLALHALILMVGGHYTYARVPLGFVAQDALDLSRNHYDRLGHVAQGFVPAIVAREARKDDPRASSPRPDRWSGGRRRRHGLAPVAAMRYRARSGGLAWSGGRRSSSGSSRA